MPDTLLVVFCVAFAFLALFWCYSHRNVKRQLQDYKDLFELADASTQEALTKSEEAQAKLEGLFQIVSNKNMALALTSQNLDSANARGEEQDEEISGLKSAVEFQEEQYIKLLGQKKSSEVRTGKITEQIAPFLEDYPLDSRTAKFIGDPIDFVHFDEEKVTFVEVKSGKSQLSKKQRQIRDLIKAGKVEFTIYRVEGK
jgi:predicted Holliday junction resolvase-like endonuclease